MDKKGVAELAGKKEHERTDDDWEAIFDARKLVQAEQIKLDAKRYAAAKKWAAVLVLEEKTEAEAMQKIADA